MSDVEVLLQQSVKHLGLVGDVVKVKVLEVDRQGRIRLSMKAVSEDEAANA